MKNILYVFGAEKASGAENVILRLLEANLCKVNPHIFLAPGDFARNIIDTKNFVFHGNVTIRNQLKKLNRSQNNRLNFGCKAIINHIANSVAVIKYVKKNNIDIVHANTIVPAFYLIPAIIYSKIFFKSVKWVWSDHDLKYFSTIDYSLSRICVKFYDITFAVSNAVRQKFILNDKVVVLYNGFDVNSLVLITDKELSIRHLKLNIPEGCVVIGIAASIIRRKGILELITAFKKINQCKNNIKLLLAGHLSEDEIKYKDIFLKEIQHNDSIQYLGAVSNITEFYSVCDIIVNNSLKDGSEPFGTTIIEAMAHGKITIASNTGGTPEIINNGEDGLLFEADNVEMLEKCLLYCIENVSNLSFMKNNAINKVSNKFNIKNMVNLYNTYLESLNNS